MHAKVTKKYSNLVTPALNIAPITATKAPIAIRIFGFTFIDAIIGFIIIKPTVIIGITVTASA